MTTFIPIAAALLHESALVCPACKLIIQFTSGVPGGRALPEEPVKHAILVCSSCDVVLVITPEGPTLTLSRSDEALLPGDLQENLAAIRKLVRDSKAAGIWPAPRYAQ